MSKKPPTPRFDNSDPDSSQRAGISQSIWRSTILQGVVEMLPPLMQDGFTADSPVCALDRSPLIDIALTVPDDHHHAVALADMALALMNNGATLNMPDYKGLLPADYALSSPNPLVARQILLGTLRDQTNKGLAHPYRPQMDVLFCLAMCKPERIKLHKNITTNLQAFQEWLTVDNIKSDPRLLAQDPYNLEFWQNLSLKRVENYPRESTSMRQQFRKVSALIARVEQSDPQKDGTFFSEALEHAESRYRLLENRHAQRFYAKN